MTYNVHYRGRDVTFERFGGPSIERYLSSSRFYEPDMLQYIEALRLPGAYVDAGAYVGTHSIFFALYCPPSTVHAFEPVAEFHQVLARNVAANAAADRIRLHAVGLSDVVQTVETELEGRRSVIDCRRLDDLIDEPISLIKVDVEGMELVVLRGAERLIERHRPLMFLEAHTEELRGALAAYLDRFGYQATGRVFNSTPTHEFACPGSPTVPARLLPRARSLAAPALWRSRPVDGLEVRFDQGRIEGRVDVAAGGRIYVTHDDRPFARAPALDELIVEPASPLFLQVTGAVDPTADLSFHIYKYPEHGAPISERIPFHARLFRRIDLDAGTRTIRIVLRFTGKGAFQLDQVKLHAFPPVGRASVGA